MQIRGHRFLVVGGASLVGSHIADQLLAADAAHVTLFDNYSLGSPASVQHLAGHPRATIVRGDVLRLNEVIDAARGVDGVFQVAAYLAGPIAANHWVGIDVNVRGVQNVLEACRIREVKKIIYSSTVGIYGNAGHLPLIDEDTPFMIAGVSPAMMLYSTSKLVGEQLCRFYAERHGLQFLSLRYSSVYGDRQHTHSINALHIVEMYRDILAGRRPVIHGDGTEVHDYVFVDDIARANLLAMESPATGECMTIATGKAQSLNDIVRYLLEITGSTLEPEHRDDSGRLRFTSSAQLNYSRAKAERLIGWVPQVSLREGIERFTRWYQESGAGATRPA